MVDGPVPDTAMHTKSEEGDPGDPDRSPLTDEERAILDRLRDGAGDGGGTAAEDSPEYAAAVDADAPVPTSPPQPERPDPLDAIFREPNP